MILPMGRPVQMIPFWSFRGQHHITRGTGLTFAVSMYVVNVLEVLNAHIDMRCLKPGSYLNRTSKIVTMGMWWWQNWFILLLWSWLWLSACQVLHCVILLFNSNASNYYITVWVYVHLAEASRLLSIMRCSACIILDCRLHVQICMLPFVFSLL